MSKHTGNNYYQEKQFYYHLADTMRKARQHESEDFALSEKRLRLLETEADDRGSAHLVPSAALPAGRNTETAVSRRKTALRRLSPTQDGTGCQQPR
jgi:hypothetical protein